MDVDQRPSTRARRGATNAYFVSSWSPPSCDRGRKTQTRPAGVQILASLDSKWTPRDLLRDVEARKHLRRSKFCWGMGLVDLVRFELTTSSMPFKKYQSLTDVFTRNKRLSTRPRGLRWTPGGGFWASGLHADSRTPNQKQHSARSHTRGYLAVVIVAWWQQHCFLNSAASLGECER